MKKSLVLAMAMALGVTASAYAANPFSDVPAGHWAYDAVNELAAAGVVEGYGDGTYAGDKLITRYEMAQIVAKAMAKGADCDKLAAEFASELDTLGVRVAALEKKADNLKITGQIRYEWGQNKDQAGKKSTAVNRIRTRLFLNGKINEDWSYGARLENNQDFIDTTSGGKKDAGDDDLKMNRAWINGKLGGMKFVGGRQGHTMIEGLVYDDSLDGVKLSYGSKVKVTGYYGKPTQAKIGADTSEELYGASVDTKVGGLKLTLGYDEFKKVGTAKEDVALTSVTAKYSIGNVGLAGTYIYNDADLAAAKDDSYVVGLTYKGAKNSAPGSWGIRANYYDQGAYTAFAHTMNGKRTDEMKKEGFEGYMAAIDYTVAKNIQAMVEYYDLEADKTDSEVKTLWTRVQFSF